MSSCTTTSAFAKTASVAASSPVSQSKQWLSVLPSRSSRITGGVRRQRLAYVDHGRQQLVLDVDQLERVAGGVPVLGDDERDLLVLEPHLVGGQHRLHVVGQRRHPGEVLCGEVGAGDDRLDLGVRLRRRWCRC